MTTQTKRRTGSTTSASGPDRAAAALLPSAKPIRFLDDGGAPAPKGDRGPYEHPDTELLVETYRRMVIGRRFDAQATALTRQGRLAVYPSSHGQEACQVGGVLALRDTDWLFPTYRDSMALITRDIDPVEALTLLQGSWHCGYDPRATRTAPQCTPLATQSPHAVGAGVRGQAPRRGHRRHGVRRRRRHQRGRLPRGAELRRRVQGAGRLPDPEQPVRDLRAAVHPDRGAGAGLQGGRVRHPQRAGRRQRPGRRARRPAATPSSAPAPAKVRSSSRRTPTGSRRTPTPTTRAATATSPRSSPGCGATRSPASRRT